MIKLILNSLSCMLLNFIFLFFKIIGKRYALIAGSLIFVMIGPLTKLNVRAKKNLKYVWPKITQNKLDNIFKNMLKNIVKNFGPGSYYWKNLKLRKKYKKVKWKKPLNGPWIHQNILI